MYKWLLCWRYLLTRYLALACVVSITLGVATLIVVNSVMYGFSTQLQARLHDFLSDVTLDAYDPDGLVDPDGIMARIQQSPIGDKIAAMTPTLETYGMLQFHMHTDGRWPSRQLSRRPIHLIGIDLEGRSDVGGFAEHIVGKDGKPIEPSFQTSPNPWRRRQPRAINESAPRDPDAPPPPEPPPSKIKVPEGVILGHAIGFSRMKVNGQPTDVCLIQPGDDVIITTVSGQKLAPVYDRFAVTGYFKSKLSEYDAQYAYVPLAYLQKLCTMENRATSIQIKLKDRNDTDAVVAELSHLFEGTATAAGWGEKQGPLLAAIAVERGILNILLFMIVGVAGFGILAIFVMIVIEKTRDIGILKALGASNGGVMKIFLGYGLLLGSVGALCGTSLGVLIAGNINAIEAWLTRVTGQPIFDKSIYYFNEIPSDTSLWMLLFVNVGAIGIAVLSATLPALRAALLHPVRALRYE